MWPLAASCVRRLLTCTVIVAGLCGCRTAYIEVDCRLAREQTLWSRLDGPRYVVLADDEQVEASLAFEEFSTMFERALAWERPALQRVTGSEPAELMISLAYQVIDQGSGIASEPVYGFRYGHVYGRCGWRTYRSYGYVGQEVRPYHLGYLHVLWASAWVPDPSRPAGRHVLWEGRADSLCDARTLKVTMPSLVAALAQFYGQATDQPTKIKLEPDDPLLRAVRGEPEPVTMPAP